MLAPPANTIASATSFLLISAIILFSIVIVASVVLLLFMRRRGLDRWLSTYVRQRSQRRSWNPSARCDVLLCIADHYEPRHGKAGDQQAAQRVESWVSNYPRLFDRFRDADGKPPRHTFFFPIDEYNPSHVDALAALCRRGYGEVEIQLHHDNDNAGNLRERLTSFKELFASRHGVLARHRVTQELRYGFVHGNWALDNSRPDGRWCGVNNELDVLRETGCYADFTMPSAPSPTQTRKINSIYYGVDDPLKPKSHDWGVDVGAAQPRPQNALMLIQGPLLLDWKHRKAGVIPRIENGCIQASQPPSMARLDLWMNAGVRIASRPDWLFIKLHAHGATEIHQEVVLGEPMVAFHEGLAQRAASNANFRYHYVTAREMYNLARAAEAGWTSSVDEARDYELTWDVPSAANITKPSTPDTANVPKIGLNQ